ncbi:aconitate hydratase AcnA [Litorivivens sp.]|uniref:aconitate hydratase AcnA n=1 Tax=Litorivivens sp. TaxID=2020868 RepID=UPI003567CE3C
MSKKPFSASLQSSNESYRYYAFEKLGDARYKRLPNSLKVLLENQLRFFNQSASQSDIDAFLNWVDKPQQGADINFSPARVLMQDFTGVPAIVDLAAMREAVARRGGDVSVISPQVPVDLVIDHSVSVDHYASARAFNDNVKLEMERNGERYRFLKWGKQAFKNFQVVPPGTGICHQVNLEYLGKVVWQRDADGVREAYPDTLVGTDSHTPMINGLGVLGWGVGGIEAEAALLGQPVSMLLPEVIGVALTGKLKAGVTATDLVLTVVEMLRKHGVVGKFVEFHGPGLADLAVTDRATIANMTPEFGATCGFFPVDEKVIEYLRLTGRDEATLQLVEDYSKAQNLWRDDDAELVFSAELTLDLGTVEPSLAGPKRPQDRVTLSGLKSAITECIHEFDRRENDEIPVPEMGFTMPEGAVVIAAITSCTNTSNPDVMLAAGLMARAANKRGLKVKPWVKTSLAPGSKVVSDYFAQSGLQVDLDALGFNLVGYGCTTCIGNSGPLPEAIDKAIADQHAVVSAVLSGNRNFEGRIHNNVRAAWLASPPLVVAYALAGTTVIDLHSEPLGQDADGKPVYLLDIWPSNDEIQAVRKSIDGEMFQSAYAGVFEGTDVWKALDAGSGKTYGWDDESTYIHCPTFFDDLGEPLQEFPVVKSARILALLGNSVTTDHISPAGAIALESPAGKYLREKGVEPKDFNSYGSRRGNHEVMMRGTFANVRLRNKMVDREGGYTRFMPAGEEMSIYDAAMKYREENTPLVIFAGEQYGTGSSRDWAAKGTNLLGVKAVIAESFERIHRSNLVGMGVLPLQLDNDSEMLQLHGDETVDIVPLEDILEPGMKVKIIVSRNDGNRHEALARCRIDTVSEMDYFRHGGILHYVLHQLQSDA